MIHSMTGYAVASAEVTGGTLNVELRSVNSRYLDIQFRVADELRMLEAGLREAITAQLSRGKVDCRLSFSTTSTGPRAQALNMDALEELRKLAEIVRRELPAATPLRAADVLRWPGVLAEGRLSETELREQAGKLATRAIAELTAARSREGAKLSAVILERVAAMRRAVAVVAPLVPEAIAAYQEKLAQRLRDALGAADDERLRQEIAVFAMKIDVDEELQRLKTHLDEVERVLAKGGAAGKRLDFLMQELNREANTLGSKAASQPISECALELKLLIEQMREQVQNIE
ncbi:MAG: YicC family protein [Proteobacteria bacterium]|nr:YicC family protein [Pseudomonadota bacterium]